MMERLSSNWIFLFGACLGAYAAAVGLWKGIVKRRFLYINKVLTGWPAVAMGCFMLVAGIFILVTSCAMFLGILAIKPK
jgi:hypothetical protein